MNANAERLLTLTKDNPPGWYECESHKSDIRRMLYWDGKRLSEHFDKFHSRGWLRAELENHTAFVGPFTPSAPAEQQKAAVRTNENQSIGDVAEGKAHGLTPAVAQEDRPLVPGCAGSTPAVSAEAGPPQRAAEVLEPPLGLDYIDLSQHWHKQCKRLANQLTAAQREANDG